MPFSNRPPMQIAEPIMTLASSSDAGRSMRRNPLQAAGLATAVAAAVIMSALPLAAHPHVWVGTRTSFVFENGALTGLGFTWLFDEMYTTSAIDGLDKNNDGKLDKAELEELTKVNIEGLKEFDYFTTARHGEAAVAFDAPRNYSMELLEVDEGPGPQLSAPPPASNAPAAQTAAEPPRGLWSRVGGWISGLFGKSPSKSAAAPAPAAPAAGDKIKVLALHMTLPLKTPIPSAQLSAPGFQYVLNDGQMYIWFEPMPKNGIAIAPGAPSGCSYAIVEPEQDEEQKRLAEAFGGAGTMALSTPGKPVQLTCTGR